MKLVTKTVARPQSTAVFHLDTHDLSRIFKEKTTHEERENAAKSAKGRKRMFAFAVKRAGISKRILFPVAN